MLTLQFKQNMSQHSLLNIQQISSRTFNPDPSIMQTSIEHFDRQNHATFTKHDLHNMSLKKTILHNFDDVGKDLRIQNQGLKKELQFCKNRLIEMQRGNGGNINQQMIMKQMLQDLNNKDNQFQQLKRTYYSAINNLKQTLEKNDMLSKEVERLSKKLKQSELNYSRQQHVYQKSQNLISNLSITKSNYEIQLVNMKDSLIILQKQNQKISLTNQQYQQKLALVSQEIERLNRMVKQIKQEKDTLNLSVNEAGLMIKRYESQINDQKSTIERARLQNREYNNKVSALTLQLREYHQKLTYKQTIISDFKDGQAKIQKLIHEKEGYIKELQSRLMEMQRNIKIKQDEITKQRNSYTQQVGKLRSKINEESSSNKQIANRNQNIQRQYQNLFLQFNSLKDELNKQMNEKNALGEEFKSISGERDFLIREKQELIRELDGISNISNQKDNQIQQLKTGIKEWQQKYQKIEVELTMLSHQRSSEVSAKASELKQCKYELASKIDEINQIKSEVNIKSSEIIRLKEETTSQSTIFDHSKRDFDERLRERSEIINDLKNRLSNCEKLIEQNRRERDLLIQQNNSLANAKQKVERFIELKNQQINTSSTKIQELGRSLKEISNTQDLKLQEIENYKRIIKANQQTIKDFNFRIINGDNRVKSLTQELERMVNILKEKQIITTDLSNKCKQYASIIEKGNLQVSNLKQNNQKMHMALGYAEQSKGNFQIFLKQIERLNQIVLGKQAQIKNLRTQLAKMIQKIDQIGQQQLKIVKILEATYQSSSQKDLNLNNQFTDLKEYISRLNQNTNASLKDLSLQSNNIINQLSQTENDTRQSNSRVQQKLMESQKALQKKQSEIALLKREINELNTKIQQYEKSSVHQSQIFQKILQLSRENAAVREQLIKISSQRDFQIENKNKSITYLQSQVNQLESTQGKQLIQLKHYIQQKQHIFEQNRLRLSEENELLKHQLHNKELLVVQLQNRLKHFSFEIDNKMKYIKEMEKQVQIYKQVKRESQQAYNQKGQIDVYLKQIAKLQKIIELRQEQISKNQQSFSRIQNQLKKYKHSTSQSSPYKQRYIQLSLKLQQRTLQKDQIEQKLKEAQNMIYYLQQTQGKTNNSSQSTRQFQALKQQNEALDRKLKLLYTKLRQSEGKLGMTQEQVSHLMQDISRMTEMRNQINKMKEIEILQNKIQELQDKNYNLQTELQQRTAELNQYRIQNSYLHQSTQHSKIFLHSYEYKSGEIERQYKKLKEVYDNLSREYSKLEMKNHEFEIQLKKASILQQKIQVLNGQLNRLSLENIDLNEQISQCKLALGDESTIQRRNTQLLTLIVLLMAEVQSLRSRVSTQEVQLNNSRILHLGRYKS